MKAFKKLFNLQWKKNSIWLILLIVASLLINTLSFRYNANSIYKGLTSSVKGFEDIIGINNKKKKQKPEQLDKNYLKYGDRLRNKLVKKYDIITDDLLSKMDSNELDAYYAENRSELYFRAENLVSTYDMYKDQVMNNKSQNWLVSQYQNFFMYPFLFILAMLLTSIEQMTTYFDFTRMYPWSKIKDFAMKLAFGLIISLLVFLVQIGLENVLISTSGLGKLFNTKGLLYFYLKELKLYWLILVIFMSTGAMSGNIFGHIGLNIIAFGLCEIFAFDITTIQEGILGTSYDQTLTVKFDEFLARKGGLIAYLLSPLRKFDLSNNQLIAYSILALISLLIALIVVKNMKTENSGYMVINKPIKIISLILACLTLTSIIFTIVTSAFADYNVYIGVALYLFFLFGSYKLFNALFNIKIKV
ncbi:MAG: hypothetical protein PUG67_01745 [Peptoniphilaceae bacterium]|nr:hypothetical protein [Peptoniphilaceae bacterium]MDY6019720.1 hypothetical protein [Anaerococcus sp.]